MKHPPSSPLPPRARFAPWCAARDADMVMFLYREEYYKPDSEKKGQAELIIAKQRSGPTGTVELAWLAQYTKFGNLERESGNS